MYYWHWIKNLVRKPQTTGYPTIADPAITDDWNLQAPRGTSPEERIPYLRRSCAIRHVDAGSCNGCESELSLLSSPTYDFSRYGFRYVPSPKHADVLVVTGVITEVMVPVLQAVYAQLGHPKRVVAVGECPLSGHVFKNAPGVRGSLAEVLPVTASVSGCPPTPPDILRALFVALDGADPIAPGGSGS